MFMFPLAPPSFSPAFLFFFFNDAATTEIYTLSLHDALPIWGALMQPTAGTARHDAVVWGFARAASRLGVDIIQKCEVTGFLREGGRIRGVETTRGPVMAAKTGIAVAGHTSRLGEMAGLRLPIESHLLQAFVSEPVKPLLDYVIGFGGHGHFYIS